jgi:hypothetical protein
MADDADGISTTLALAEGNLGENALADWPGSYIERD